jgi:hypothetical protein
MAVGHLFQGATILAVCVQPQRRQRMGGDLWAMCAFYVLAQRLGCQTDLLKFLDRHPEKLTTYLLVSGAVIYTNGKTRLIQYFKRLLPPFKLA